MLNIYFTNGVEWNYTISKTTEIEIFAYDPLDSTFIKYNRNTGELYSYDSYYDLWKFMKNTTAMIHKVEIKEEL